MHAVDSNIQQKSNFSGNENIFEPQFDKNVIKNKSIKNDQLTTKINNVYNTETSLIYYENIKKQVIEEIKLIYNNMSYIVIKKILLSNQLFIILFITMAYGRK